MQGKSRNQAFKGHEIFQNEIKMYLKMAVETSQFCIVIQFFLFITIACFLVTPEVIGILIKYLGAKAAIYYNHNPNIKIMGVEVTAEQLLKMHSIPRMISGSYAKLYMSGLF